MQLIAPGITYAESADFTVTADTPVTVWLTANDRHADYRAQVSIQIKSSDGTYTAVGRLGWTESALVIHGPGTYRVVRYEGFRVGVERS